LDQAIADLDSRLYDVPSLTGWSQTELQFWIVEALRTWNALTSTWRAEMTFPLTTDIWYDLTAQSGSIRAINLTDNYILQAIEYCLAEPTTPTYPMVWPGSTQFSLANILGAMTRRQNEILQLTRCTLTRTTPTAAIQIRTVLPDTTLDVVRVVWLPQANMQGYVPTILRQADVWEKKSFDSGWKQGGEQPPNVWMQSTQPPPAFDVDYVPPLPGTYEVLSAQSGAVFDTSAAQALSVPDDWSWVLKWGALSTLLGEEVNAIDPLRVAYCKQRFEDGIRLLAMSPAVLDVLDVTVNGQQVFVSSVREGDDFNAGWEAQTPGTPESVYLAGLNLVGFAPPPDSGPYSILAVVVENAPVPAFTSDYLQVSRSDYSAVLDYAQHLAMFRIGGEEFTQSLKLYQRFLRRAADASARLAEMGQFARTLYELSNLVQERLPEFSSMPLVEVGNG
jgi:hypothetical protein